jgi:hypothetical protein
LCAKNRKPSPIRAASLPPPPIFAPATAHPQGGLCARPQSRSKEELRAIEDRLLIEIKRLEGVVVQQQQALLNVKNDFFKTILAMVMSAVREHAVGAGVMCSLHDRSALPAPSPVPAPSICLHSWVVAGAM